MSGTVAEAIIIGFIDESIPKLTGFTGPFAEADLGLPWCFDRLCGETLRGLALSRLRWPWLATEVSSESPCSTPRCAVFPVHPVDGL